MSKRTNQIDELKSMIAIREIEVAFQQAKNPGMVTASSLMLKWLKEELAAAQQEAV